MSEKSSLNRFISAQESTYETALREVKNGRKQSHWMWFIFPQIQGLGQSETSRFYAIKNLTEAQEYLRHPILGKRLIQICEGLLAQDVKNATQIFGSPDDRKLCSCMTLFSALPESDKTFNKVLAIFFDGIKDRNTLDRIK